MSAQERRQSFAFDFRTVLAARGLLLFFALLSAVAGTVFFPDSREAARELIVPIGLLLGVSLASIAWYRPYRPLQYAQLGIDVLIVTAAVYVTGGPISPFLFLYVTPVMIAAIFFNRRVSLLVGAASAVAYGLLIAGLSGGWILGANGERVAGLVSGELILQGIGLCSAMILIAVLTSYLATKLSSHSALIEQSRRDLHELSQKQQVLIEGIPEGLLTTTSENRVSFINQSAADLFGVDPDAVVGVELAQFFAQTTRFPATFSMDYSRSSELTLNERDGETHKIVIHPRPLQNENGSGSGHLLVFEDVTKLRSIEEQLEMQERLARLLAEKAPQSAGSSSRLAAFVGESPVMKKVFSLIDRVAPSDATVLICGESGTGKELVARGLHLGSTRSNKSFVPVNCGAIPENLIESELFGHKRGSFTGAEADHMGLFRQADGGTIFLDEIGELPLQMQTKLLRTIQQKAVRPVGGDRDIPINVRIVAATNRNLKKEIEASNFREDLFYRLNVININLPPLRDRKDDLPLLVNASLKRLVTGPNPPVVPPATMQLLMQYSYPGNVRELENIIERALVLGGEVILPEHLPDNVRQALVEQNNSVAPSQRTEVVINENIEFPVKLDEVLATIERRYLEVALVQTNGAKKRAATLLGMNFRSFRYRLQKFGIGDGADDEV